MGDVATQRIFPAEKTEAIERLRKERRDHRADFRAGYEGGRLWFLSHATYANIRQIVHKVEENGLHGSSCYASSYARDDMGFDYKRIQDTVRISSEQWKIGFLQAVIDLWKEVGESIEEGDPIEEPWRG